MRKWPWFLLSFVVIVLDQISKTWALQHLLPAQPIAICNMINFHLAFNTGAAFSFLSHSGEWHRWFFASFSLLMSIVIMVWLCRLTKAERLQALGLSFILGGALGNFVDRLRYGHVIDFIDVYYQQYHWPVFNLADSAITIGAIFLLIEMIFASKESQR